MENIIKKMCIYKITCSNTKKIYIGRTMVNIKKRLQQHFADSKYVKNNSPLHFDMKIFDRNSFIIEPICEFYAKSFQDADIFEQYYIDKYNAFYPNGYNVKKINENNTKYSKSYTQFIEKIKKNEDVLCGNNNINNNKEYILECFNKTWVYSINKKNKEYAQNTYIKKMKKCKMHEDVQKKAQYILKEYIKCKKEWEEEETDKKFIPMFSTWLNRNIGDDVINEEDL